MWQSIQDVLFGLNCSHYNPSETEEAGVNHDYRTAKEQELIVCQFFMCCVFFLARCMVTHVF